MSSKSVQVLRVFRAPAFCYRHAHICRLSGVSLFPSAPKLTNLFTIKMITFNSRQRKEGTYLVQGIFPTSNAYLPFDVSVIKGLLGFHNDLQNGQELIYWALTVATIN